MSLTHFEQCRKGSMCYDIEKQAAFPPFAFMDEQTSVQQSITGSGGKLSPQVITRQQIIP